MRRIIIIISLMLLSACNSDEAYRYLTSGPVSWKLEQEIQDKHANEIDMNKIVTFKWDELFIFRPYTLHDYMCTTLEVEPEACEKLKIPTSTDDGEMVMVFRNQKQVVHSELHYRSYRDSRLPKVHLVFTPQTAIFTVQDDGTLALKEP